MPDRKPVSTTLQEIANKAQSQPEYRFRNLYGLLNEDWLHDCWPYLRKDAAAGVDRVRATDYEANLDENIRNLVQRLKEKRYRAQSVRRRYIPKGGSDQLRPLGIPATEDKLVQLAVKRLLESIYEQDFLRCSYGYRPNVSPLNAVDKLTLKLQFGQYHYVVEADIQGFFDNLDHDWLLKMLAQRVDDQALLRLLQKWLKAGILETEGQVLQPPAGTPQGGVISPVLANIYLHYALDLWFAKVIQPQCRGEACLIRFADDFVVAFEYQTDAEQFYDRLGQRLEKFGLQLAGEKTRVLPFSPKEGLGKTSFEFLGFEFRWGHDRKGQPRVQRRTAPKRLKRAVKNFKAWMRECRSLSLTGLFNRLNAKLRGYYNYFGVKGNFDSLHRFFTQAMRLLWKQLNQRSQRKSFNWTGFRELLDWFNVERPRITAKRPKANIVYGWTEAAARSEYF
jgi:group II intron reverse transcriptase/maturase